MVCSDSFVPAPVPSQPLPPFRALQPQEAAGVVGRSVGLPGEGIKKNNQQTLPVILLSISCCTFNL